MLVKGVPLARSVRGSGRPVVFVHGSGSDRRMWQAQRDAIARRFLHVDYDQRYFGLSPWPDDGAGFSLRSQVEDLAMVIRALDAGPAHLVGLSMSADTVLATALKYPELVLSAFLHEPSLRGFEFESSLREQIDADFRSAIDAALGALREGRCVQAVRMFMDGVNDQPGAVDSLPAWLQQMAADNARTLPLQVAARPLAFTSDDLRRIDIPVAITCGARTRPCYGLAAEVANGCLSHSRLIVVPSARHLWPVQDPGAFTAALLIFLADVEAT